MEQSMTKNDRKTLLKLAYEKGYKHYDPKVTMDEIPDGRLKQTHGPNSWSEAVSEIEDRLGFDSQNEDWGNQGIYGIIEDSSVSYKAGARDAINNYDHNPDRLSYMWA